MNWNTESDSFVASYMLFQIKSKSETQEKTT